MRLKVRLKKSEWGVCLYHKLTLIFVGVARLHADA